MGRVVSIRMEEETHQKLKLLALIKKKSIGDLIDELVGGLELPTVTMNIPPQSSSTNKKRSR
jgi:predicted DNA-binding ribbon-helix-helix protein